MINILPLDPGEVVTAWVLLREFKDDEYLVMVTKQGTVKRMHLNVLDTRRRTGIRAMHLENDDELVSVFRTNGNDNVLIATHEGLCLCFSEQDIRTMGREAAGVRGIRLGEGDYVIGAELYREGSQLLTITENGFGKRTRVEEYLRGVGDDRAPQSRGGKGMKNYNVTEKTGKIAGIQLVEEDDDVIITESSGVIIRMPAANINLYKRDVQGVRVMKLDADNRVIAVTSLRKEDEEAEGEETTAEE